MNKKLHTPAHVATIAFSPVRTASIFAIFMFLLWAGAASGQAVGDYRSNATGNWDVLGTWQRYDGANWVAPNVGQGYPGQNSGTGNVTIRSGHNVTLNVSPMNSFTSLTVTGVDANNRSTLSTGSTNRTLPTLSVILTDFGQILWTGNMVLTLPPGAALTIFNNGMLATSQNCTGNQRLNIGTSTYGFCNGNSGEYTFAQLNAQGGTIAAVLTTPTEVCAGSSFNVTVSYSGQAGTTTANGATQGVNYILRRNTVQIASGILTPSTPSVIQNITNAAGSSEVFELTVNTFVVSNQFTNTQTKTVTVHPNPAAPGSGGNQIICANQPIPALTVTVGAGATADWYDAATGGNLLLSGSLSYTPTMAGTYYAEARNTTTGCRSTTRTAVTLTIHPNPSAPSSGGNQTICTGDPIPALTVTVGAGETADWYDAATNGTLLQSGSLSYTPAMAGTYYAEARNTTTGCRSTTRTAVTLTINASNTISLTSAPGTDAQTVCINFPITPITYSTTSATGANFGGLPSGVTGSWASNTVTISGTPTESGAFNYTVTLTGGCGMVEETGSITVNPTSIGGTASSNQTICTGGTPADLTLTGHTGSIQWQSSPDEIAWSNVTGATGTTLTGAQMGALTATTYYRAVVTSGVCAPAESTTVTIAVVADPSWDDYAFSPTILCAGGAVTFSASVTGGLGGTVSWVRSNTPGGAGTAVISPDAPPSAGTWYYRPQYAATGAGCNLDDGTETTVTVVPDPLAPTATKSPDQATVCAGEVLTLIDVTDNGGGTGNCIIEYSYNGGPWTTTLASFVAEAGSNSIAVRKVCEGLDCDVSMPSTYTWTGLTLSVSSSSSMPVCTGGSVTLTATPSTGAESCTLQWQLFNGTTWENISGQTSTTYAPPTSTAGATRYRVVYTCAGACTDAPSNEATVQVNLCLSGKLIWKGNGSDDSGIALAEVFLNGPSNDYFASTGIDGEYNLNASAAGSHTISPRKTVNPSNGWDNGMDVADVVAIQKHIVGMTPITDLFRLVAADLNRNRLISTQDAVILRQAILNIPTALAIVQTTRPWRFIPTNHDTNAFTDFDYDAFSETRTVPNADPLDEQDFWGVKVGDVAGTPADPTQGTTVNAEPLAWYVQDRYLQAGETLEVDFFAWNFSDIAAYQFALDFDPAALQFQQVEVLDSGLPLSAEGNFGLFEVPLGEIRTAFAGVQGFHLPEDAPVFRLRFTALQSGQKLSDVLHLALGIMPARAYNNQLHSVGLGLHFLDALTSAEDLAARKLQLLQNRPNPFSDETVISFVLPEACDAQLRVLDLTGRELLRIRGNYAAGYNEERVQVQASGVLVYELSTPFGVMTRKMIKQ